MVKIQKFGQNSEIQLKLWKLVKILKFGWNSEIWSKIRNLVRIGHNSEAEFWNRLCNPQPWINDWLTDKGGHRATRAAKMKMWRWEGEAFGKNISFVEPRVSKIWEETLTESFPGALSTFYRDSPLSLSIFSITIVLQIRAFGWDRVAKCQIFYTEQIFQTKSYPKKNA